MLIGVLSQDLSDESCKSKLVIHVVNMPNGKTGLQVELTGLANWHSLLDMRAIPIGIAKVIDDAARAQGLTLPALAARTSLSYTSVFRKVREKSRSINVEELAEFAAALDMQASDLLVRAEAALALADGAGALPAPETHSTNPAAAVAGPHTEVES